MKQYKIEAHFRKGYLVSTQINLVTEDYKSTEFIFEFDMEEGRKVFELKKPDGSKYIKNIIDNKITLVDYDTELNEISLIPMAGTYEFELVNYTEDSKLTLQEHGHFEVRGEIVEVNDSEVKKDTRLPILDSLINDVEGLKTDINSSVENATEQATYAKAQGDYAKEQAQIIIDANTTATKIINDFETNVNKYTKDFNANAESKENSYNENASNKLKEYNDNATTKLSEYNSNSETKTTAFNTNASEKTDAFNLNVTNKTTDFNSNAEAKTTEFNDNATTKTEEYNTNAEAKVNEFNTNVDELKQDVEDCYNNMLTNEAEGTSIHVEDSANARIISLESEGNYEQVTTTGKNKLDFNALVANVDFVTKNNDGSYSVTGNGSAVSIATIDYELEAGTYYISADYTNSKDLVNSETGNLLAFNMALEDGTSQWVSLIRTDDVAGTRRSVKFTTDKKATRIHLQAFERFASGTITFKNVQIGSDSNYKPYTNGASPNPDYPQDVEVIEEDFDIKSIGKNRLDLEVETYLGNLKGLTPSKNEDGSITITGTGTDTWSNIIESKDIKLKVNEKIFFSIDKPVNYNVQLRLNYTDESQSTIVIYKGNTSTSFVPTKETKSYYVYLYNADGLGEINDTLKIQLEVGEVATEYEPYQENTVDINLQGNFIGKIGDVADTLRVENGRAILTKRIGKFVPTSSTNVFSVSSATQENSKFYGIDGTGLKGTNNNLVEVYSNIFGRKTANGLWNADVKNYCSVNTSGNLHFRVDSSLTSVSDVRQLLLDNNTYFLGVLATPYEVDLGEVKMPKTFEGVTNISLISNLESNMKLKYVRSTNIVVDNLAKAIVAMGGEINV